MEKQKVRVSKERRINTYEEMWKASHAMLYKAEKDIEGSYYQLMASLIFTAFTLEAYLNHIGKQIFGCWDDLERRLSPRQKLNVIAEKLGVEKNDGKRPFQTVKKLFDFRNDIAHGKTISLKTDDETQIMDSELDNYVPKPLEAEWEKYCTQDNAKLAREDVKTIMQTLQDASGITDRLFLSGVQLGTQTLMTLEH